MISNLSIGTKLQRLKGNQQIITIKDIQDDIVTIQDAYTTYTIELSKITDEYFTILEPAFRHDTIAKSNNNFDDSQHHNIAGGMNSPSNMQEYAFDKNKKR